MAGTGLEVKQPADEVAGTGLAANSQPMTWPAQTLKQKPPADEVAGTGLVANSQQMKLAGTFALK